MADQVVDVQVQNGVERATFMRSRRFLILAAGAILVVAAGVVWFVVTANRESTDDAQVEASVTQISPRVGGTVLRVMVNDNQLVDEGTVLVEIDPRDYQVAVDKARAELADAEGALVAALSNVPITSTTATSSVTTAQSSVEQAQSAVDGAEKEVEASKARLVTAQARVREAEANAAKAGRDVERLRGLLAKDEVSQQQFDTATAAAEAHVAQAKATLAQAELNLLYTTIKAPAKGIVSKKAITPGQVVQANQPLMAVVHTDRAWVVANFKETQLNHIRAGQSAEIEVDAYGGRRFKGRLDSIAGATGARFSLLPPENATGNFVKVVQRVPVKIVLDEGQDPERLLRPGMSVTAVVYTK
jgi:membrane fusion protein, multidrug efflux system